MLPLTLLNSGEKAEVLRVKKANGKEFDENLYRLDEMGLKPGKEIEMLQTDNSVVLVKVDNSRIAVSKKIAIKIFVRKI